MSGVGGSPMGAFPYGLGTILPASDNGGVILPDAFGVTQGSRFINARTRSYEYDEHGRAKGMSNVASLVQMCLLMAKGSSAMADLGEVAPSGVIGANFVSRRKSEIKQALKRLVDTKTIAIVSIDVDVKSRPVFTIIRWRDMTTLIEGTTRL